MNYDVVRDLRQLADWAETVLLKIDKAGLPKPDYQGLGFDDQEVVFRWNKVGVKHYSIGFERLDVYVRVGGESDYTLRDWKDCVSGSRVSALSKHGIFQAEDTLPEDLIKTLQDVVRPLKETK